MSILFILNTMPTVVFSLGEEFWFRVLPVLSVRLLDHLIMIGPIEGFHRCVCVLAISSYYLMSSRFVSAIAVVGHPLLIPSPEPVVLVMISLATNSPTQQYRQGDNFAERMACKNYDKYPKIHAEIFLEFQSTTHFKYPEYREDLICLRHSIR